MEDEYKVKSALSTPNLNALLIAHKQISIKIRAAEKTIETKIQLIKKRKAKIDSIGRRIAIINKMPFTPGTMSHPDSSHFVRDQKKLTIQVKADQTTIETKLRVVRGLKKTLTEIENQINVAKNMSSTAKQHLVWDDLKADTKLVIKKPKSKKKSGK